MTAAGSSLLTTARAAAVLGISLRQLRRIIARGEIQVVRVSERTIRVRPEELTEFIASRSKRYAEPARL